MRTYNTIVIPTDLSAASVPALREAVALAGPGTRLQLILVIDRIARLGVADPGEDAMRERLAEEALAEFAQEHGLAHVGQAVRSTLGNAAIEITRYAEELEADLVVVASHGRTGVRLVKVGSVAERVVRYSPCPVLVVKSPPAEA